MTFWMLAILILLLRAELAKSFLRGYFNQKQRNLGLNPKEVLKAQCKWFYWFLF